MRAYGQLEDPCMDSSKKLMFDSNMWALVHEAELTNKLKAIAARMASTAACCAEFDIAQPNGEFPVNLFRLLHLPE